MYDPQPIARVIRSECMKNSLITLSEDHFMFKHTTLFMAIIIMISLLVCGLYLNLRWIEHQQTETQVAVMLVESLASQLDPQDISALSGSQEDLDKTEYLSIKRNLSKLVEKTNLISFAYLFGEQNGNMIFLADSEPPDSPDYSPPGQIYQEASDNEWEPFRSGKTVMTEASTDRWGTWRSALVPITNPESGEVIAVLGLDYSASMWSTRLQQQMIPDVIIAFLFILFIIALSRVWYLYSKLKVISDRKTRDEALYHSVFDQAPIGIAIVNNKKFVSQSGIGNVDMNPMFEKTLGRTNRELANTEWMDITHPDDLQADLEMFEQFKSGKIDEYTMKKRFLKPDGSYVWTDMKIVHFLDSLRDNPMHLCLLDDISTEKEIENSLIESERSKSVLLSNLPGMAYRCIFDSDWTMQFASAGSIKLTGYNPEDLINNKVISFKDLIAPEYRELFWNEWTRVITDRVPFRCEHEIIMATGERKWAVGLGQGIYNEHGDIESLEGIVLDISDRKEIEYKIQYDYRHDKETDLYNLNSFHEILINDSKKKNHEKRAVININLSSFQRISMIYGFNYTQELIKNTARILKQFSTDNCMLFRTSENRFVYYIKGYSDKNELWEISQKIKDALWEILKVERVGAGIGIFEMDDAEEFDLNKASKKALITSNKAIEMDENEIGICFYDSALEAQIQREEEIKQELNQIVENEDSGHLSLQFQPILDLEANRISSFEALARIRTDKLGHIPPLEFIPIAEKTKLIIPLGWIITHQAFEFQKRLRSLGYDGIGVAVNVSAIQLFEIDFTTHLFELIDEMQVSPSNIYIEITESVFASDYNQINAILDELREHGLEIFIDDFGTGYSSLARARDLNVDCLKIDKTFIDKIMVTQYDKEITGDIIAMAHKRGHVVIAEGVEYEEQRQYLQNNGCDKIQGYLISKPLDADDAIELLRQEKK